MSGRALLTVPGFLSVPTGVQESTAGTSIIVGPLQAQEWSQIGTIVPDSGVPDQERRGQEGKNVKVCAGLRFLVPGVPGKSSGTIIGSNINRLVAVPGFLPSLKRGDGFQEPSPSTIAGEQMGAATMNRGRLRSELRKATTR